MKESNKLETLSTLNGLNMLYNSSKLGTFAEQMDAHEKLMQFVSDQEVVDITLELFQDLATWKLKYNKAISDENNFLEASLL